MEKTMIRGEILLNGERLAGVRSVEWRDTEIVSAPCSTNYTGRVVTVDATVTIDAARWLHWALLALSRKNKRGAVRRAKRKRRGRDRVLAERLMMRARRMGYWKAHSKADFVRLVGAMRRVRMAGVVVGRDEHCA